MQEEVILTGNDKPTLRWLIYDMNLSDIITAQFFTSAFAAENFIDTQYRVMLKMGMAFVPSR